MIDPNTFRPLGDRIIVRDLPEPPNQYGLVVVREHPELANVVSSTLDGSAGDYRRVGIDAEVIAVGTGKRDKKGRLIPLGVKKGDVVRCTAGWNDLGDLLPHGFRMITEGDIHGHV